MGVVRAYPPPESHERLKSITSLNTKRVAGAFQGELINKLGGRGGVSHFPGVLEAFQLIVSISIVWVL